MSYITFKSINSRDMGIHINEESIPKLPQAKSIEVNPNTIDGSWDFTKSNKKKRIMYNNRIFTITLAHKQENIQRLSEKATDIAEWLSGAGDLILGSMPNKVWKARVYNLIDFKPPTSRMNITSVQFIVEPYAYSLREEVITDNITNNKSFTINYDGTAHTWAEIELIGNSSNAVIQGNGSRLEYRNAFSRLKIDNRNYLAINNNKVDMKNTYGDFFEMEHGINNIDIKVTGECNSTIKYFTRWL